MLCYGFHTNGCKSFTLNYQINVSIFLFDKIQFFSSMQDKELNIQKLYRTNLYYLKKNEGQSVNCTLRHLWPVYKVRLPQYRFIGLNQTYLNRRSQVFSQNHLNFIQGKKTNVTVQYINKQTSLSKFCLQKNMDFKQIFHQFLFKFPCNEQQAMNCQTLSHVKKSLLRTHHISQLPCQDQSKSLLKIR